MVDYLPVLHPGDRRCIHPEASYYWTLPSNGVTVVAAVRLVLYHPSVGEELVQSTGTIDGVILCDRGEGSPRPFGACLDLWRLV